MLQTLKLNNKKRKKASFYEEKSLVGLTPELRKIRRENCNLLQKFFKNTSSVKTSCRHIQTAFHYMWRMATGLANVNLH
jgi:hypothetical protein